MVSDSGDDRFSAGMSFLTDQNETLTVTGARMGKHGRIIKFREVAERNRAESLRGRILTIGSDQRRRLDDDEFWPEQLIGLMVVTTDGETVGTVRDVMFGDAQDRLVVAGGAEDWEIPFVEDLVPEVDPSAGRVTVRPIPGLVNGAG